MRFPLPRHNRYHQQYGDDPSRHLERLINKGEGDIRAPRDDDSDREDEETDLSGRANRDCDGSIQAVLSCEKDG